MGVIYALCDPNTGEVRYVGKTVRAVEDRVKGHVQGSRWMETHCARWLRKLGTAPDVLILEETDDLDRAERDWIAGLRAIGYRLTNLTNGGTGNDGTMKPFIGHSHTPELKAAWSKKRKGVPKSKTHREAISRAMMGNTNRRRHAPR